MVRLSSSLGLFLVTIVAMSPILLPISFTATWSGEYRLTTYSNVDSVPSITQTHDRKIWIVWERQAASSLAIFYTTSSDYGISWSQEKNITRVPSADTNIDPSIAQLSNGTILVVWASNRPPPPEPDFVLSADLSSLTIPQGSSNTSTIVVTSVGGFSSPINLTVKTTIPPSPHISTSLTPEQVTPPPNGDANSTLSITVEPATMPGDYTIIVQGYSESLSKTQTVNVALTVTAAGSSTFSSSHTAPQFIFPSQTHDYEIYYKASHDNGASWSTTVRLTHDSADDKGPVVMQASNGTIWLVWSSRRTGNYEIWYKTSSDMGASWSNATPLTSDAAADAFPAVAQMSDSRIWVAWHSGRYLNNGGMEILYDIYDGASWLGVERLTDTSKDIDDTSPALLQTANGTIWVFWASEGLEQAPFILYKHSSDNGNKWSPTIEFTAGLSVDKYPATTQTIDTRIWVVWASLRDGNWEIYYKYSGEDVIHDVAITNVVPATSAAKQGDFVSITVVAENQGSEEESFEVSCYAESTLIGSETVNSSDWTGNSTEIYLTWNTTNFPMGIYVISATASSVEGEVDIGDNTFIDGTVELTAPIHDVAVIAVTPAANVVLQGDTIPVDVTAQNQGTEVETFDVTCEVDSTSIGSQTITVDPANSSVLMFTWSTSGYAVGNYVVSASASEVPGEENMGNNVFIDGIVEVVAQPFYDVAVTKATSSPTSVVKGQLVYVDVTVKNKGSETETFSVTAKYDDTEIGTQTVASLPSGDVTTKTFTWNTTGVSVGNYTIQATAETRPDEVDPSDNTFVDGTITVLPYRDIAVSDVTANPTEVVKPASVLINVTVVNEGEVGETFNVTVHYDGIEIDYSHIGVSLEAGANTTLTFTWDTTAVDAGTYIVFAKVSVVPYETDIDDNVFTNGDVIVTRPPGVPVASFTWTPSEPLVTEVIAFNATASYDQDGGTIERYYWDFGDDTNGTDIVVNHTYMVTGQYRVSLTVEDDEGNTDSVLHIVAVYTRDVAIVNVTAYPTKVVVGELVFINVTIVNEGGLSETFNVTAHYNATQIGSQKVALVSAGANITLTFVWNTTGLATGKYVLQVCAGPVPGETDIADNSYTNGQITLTMFPLAVFTYTPSAPLVGGTITFDATESRPNGGVITQYKWTFGDNKTGWGKIMKYSYATTGAYIVRLTIADSEGLTDFLEKVVVVHTAPIALFDYTPSFPKAGEPITFNASASYSPEGSAIASYNWNFGDNATGTDIISIHTYENPGNYTVTLTIQDTAGSEDTEAMTIMINEATLPSPPWPIEVLVIVTMVIVVGVILTALFFRKRKSNVK